jgi:hypothetical protein
MGHISWRKYGIAGPKREALVAYLDQYLVALNEVEPFFLCIVQMAHGPPCGTLRCSIKKKPAWVSL